MKTVTEYANFTLQQALKSKAELAAAGKTPEEIQQSLVENFKVAEEKVGHFMAALDVAGNNPENLKRVLVMTLAEGERVPPKAAKVEDHYYVPEFHADPRAQKPKSDEKGGRGGRGGKGGRGGRGGDKGRGGEKESPWGLSPEQKAAKQGKGPTPKA